MADILTKIIAHKQTEIAALLPQRDELRAAALDAPHYPSFKEALARPGVSIIAEIKKASPSAGIICEDFDPPAIAQGYVNCGARAVSVLTDEEFFKGHLTDLVDVRKAIDLPLIRKDFVVDPVQLYQAKIAGASAFLLIAGVLTAQEMADFIGIGKELGLDALVEVHDGDELTKALQSKPEIVGVNNRNLRTFVTTLDTSFDLIGAIREAGVDVAVSESGIKDAAEIQKLSEAGYDAFLIGESLMREGEKLKGFVS